MRTRDEGDRQLTDARDEIAEWALVLSVVSVLRDLIWQARGMGQQVPDHNVFLAVHTELRDEPRHRIIEQQMPLLQQLDHGSCDDGLRNRCHEEDRVRLH